MSVVKTDGNVEIIAGSTDPVTFQIFQKNGIDPEPIPSINSLTLWIRNKTTNEVTSFTSPKVVVVDEDLGTIKFTPATDDFSNSDAAQYHYHFSFNDNTGTKIKVPVDSTQYLFTVFRNHES